MHNPIQRRAQIIGPAPVQHRAGGRHLVEAGVAGMIHSDHHIAGPRHGQAEPGHDARTAAETVGEEDHRSPPGVRERRVRRHGANLEQRPAGRPDVDALFLCRVRRGIPGGHADACTMLRVTQRRRAVRRRQMPFADNIRLGGSTRETDRSGDGEQ